MEIKYIETFGWKNAIKGMRYSFDSESKSDTLDFYYDDGSGIKPYPLIGPKDLELMLKLIKAGSPHRKFLRAIHVQMSITATMTFWKQFDTYKVATTTLSRSTMHTLMSQPLSIEVNFDSYNNSAVLKDIVDYLNELIFNFNEEKNKPDRNSEAMEKLFFEAVDILPMSFLQERIIDMNYETILNIIYQRESHKLKHEWRVLCEKLLESLPYLKEFYEKIKEK